MCPPGRRCGWCASRPDGGAATEFRGRRARLGDTVDIVPVDRPGRGVRLRDDPTRSPAGLAADAAEHPVTAGRYVFYGHGMGGMGANAVAAPRRRHGLRPPDRLLIGACPPPHAASDPGAVSRVFDLLAALVTVRTPGPVHTGSSAGQ